MFNIDRQIAVFDKLAEDYDEAYSGEHFQYEDNLILSRIPNRLRKQTILDLGCGTGFAIRLLSPTEYFGFDLSSGMLKIAQRKFPHEKYRFRHSLPSSTETFDGITAWFGFWDIMGSKRLEELLATYLKPGGFFIGTLSTKLAPEYNAIQQQCNVASRGLYSLDAEPSNWLQVSTLLNEFRDTDILTLSHNNIIVSEGYKSEVTPV